MKVVAHCLIKNEDRFIWYAIMSVIDYVDNIIVWDTGSRDLTRQIVSQIKSDKIFYKKADSKASITDLRNEMIKNSPAADWFMILDGDEIWWKDNLLKTLEIAKKKEVKVIVSPTIMLIGDMYHCQPLIAGKYKIHRKVGHYNIRFVRSSINNLHVEGSYPDEAYMDQNRLKVQEFPEGELQFSKYPYLHVSHLKRSSLDRKKFKHEIGENLAKDFYYPESFFYNRPSLVSNVWQGRDFKYRLNALWQSPLKSLKRKLIK